LDIIKNINHYKYMATKKSTPKAKKPAAKNVKTTNSIMDSPAANKIKNKKTGQHTIQILERKSVPDSDPFVLRIKNASDNRQVVKIFAENANSSDLINHASVQVVNHPFVHVYSNNPDQSYENMVDRLKKGNMLVGHIYIHKADAHKGIPFLIRHKRKTAKKIHSVVHKAMIDPYQQQTCIIVYKPSQQGNHAINLNKDSWLEIELEADGIMNLILYPAKLGYSPA